MANFASSFTLLFSNSGAFGSGSPGALSALYGIQGKEAPGPPQNL